MDVWTLTLLALTGAATWLVLRRLPPRRPFASARSAAWRWVPLIAGVGLWIVTAFTLGAGVLLAPIGVALTVLAARRVARPHGAAFWLGAILNGWLAVFFVITVGIALHDSFIG